MSDAGAVPPAGAHPQARGQEEPRGQGRQAALPAAPRDPRGASAAPARIARPEYGTCAKCGGRARRPRDCEHTGWKTYCTECYVELHYYLTEPGEGG